MTSPFSSEQLIFLQRFVTSIVRSMVGEDSVTEHEVGPKTKAKPMEEPMVEPKVEPKAASKPKARPKRKFRAPTNQSIEDSPSPKIKKPNANHDVSSTKPSKPHFPIFPRSLAPKQPKEDYSGLRTDAYRVCLRCSQLGHLDDDCGVDIPAPTRHPNPDNPYLFIDKVPEADGPYHQRHFRLDREA